MRTQKQKQGAPVAVPIAETPTGNIRGENAGRKNFIIVFAAIFILFVVCIVSILYSVTKQTPSDFDLLSNMESVSMSKLEEIDSSAPSSAMGENGFIPFIEQSTIDEYREYALTEDISTYSKGDMVIYYLETT